MPKRNTIRVVEKGHHALRVLLRHGKHELENVPCPRADLGFEILEDQMRHSLGHRPDIRILDIVPHHHILEVKVGRRPEGQMRHDDPIGLASRLVHHHDIRDLVRAACRHQLRDHQVSPIEPLSPRPQQPQLLRKLPQPCRRVAARRDDDLWRARTGERVLIVVGDMDRRVVEGVGELIGVVEVGGDVLELCGEGAPGFQRGTDSAPFRVVIVLLAFKGLAVEVLAAESDLAAKHV
mmetsp:Transcript_6972/g.17087  ORF Transcript_6972/g.17087 Transcript_6972/m.17087 type:complete len:236 (+) Transcript_6972:1103-1810(+)